jgi:hypothetical protein
MRILRERTRRVRKPKSRQIHQHSERPQLPELRKTRKANIKHSCKDRIEAHLLITTLALELNETFSRLRETIERKINNLKRKKQCWKKSEQQHEVTRLCLERISAQSNQRIHATGSTRHSLGGLKRQRTN